MKKTNKLFILIMVMILTITFVSLSTTTIVASNNLQVMKSSTGSDLTYRNSTEKVYGLSEYDYPTAEYRAVWVSAFAGDIGSYVNKNSFIKEATAILDNMISMGMNALVFHVRTHNNALYDSDLNPRATFWANVNFDEFDPIEWLITECHKRGIEFHAWMNPYRVSNGYVVGNYPEGHPCNDSSLILTNSSGAKILDPGSTVVQDFIVDTCMEFLDRYDADAIHFDDYFYISGVASDLSADEKRANVNQFIYKLHTKMYEMNLEEGRAVQLGISPSGIYQNGGYVKSPTYNSDGSLKSPVYSNTSGFAHYGEYLYSDTKYWIDQEWIDYITPQTYWGMEQTGANFYELSKWWSWCVKNKSTNLYLGVGIYKALDSESDKYWKRNENEVQNQILNASMYDEVNGFCFYKYATLLQTSNKIVKNGVDLISNDYWNKRVPGVVIQKYASTMPSVNVDNLINSGTTLSWTSIDNVFGYMVYEVPKGTTLDTTNIDHLKVYTQNTSVTGINTIKYDYYVSSVNRANVVSTPVMLGEVTLKDYEQVISLINDLPTDITLDNEALIDSITTAYNALSTENKAKVTNYNVLTSAITKINKLKSLKEKLDKFIKTLDTDVNSDRILPVGENMKWSYVNASDADIYNIATGKRLKNYLNIYNIDLYLEITEDEISYKQIVKVNVGLLKSNQIGLFYRNDLSAMSEEHVGSYTGTTNFIGWSNATLTIANKVLYIAKDNYFELTSNLIPSCKWTSCAGVYVNKSNQNISVSLASAFSVESKNGYLVIGSNNKIKTVNSDSSSSVTVTLLPSETLMIIRYLDIRINNTPFSDISKIIVGTESYVTNYSNIEVTEKEEGEKIVTLIDTIPTNITLNDETLINSIKKSYDELSDQAKTYVTNFDKLTSAINKIKELKEELEKAKSNSINELNIYVTLSDYSETNQNNIKTYLKDATSAINKALTIEEIEQVINKTKTKIDKLKTLVQELEIVKTSAVSEITNYLDQTNLQDETKQIVEAEIKKTTNKINEASSSSVVENIVIEYKKQADLFAITDYAKVEKAKLEKTIKYDIFDELQKEQVNQELASILDNLTSTTTQKEVDEKVLLAKTNIDNLTKQVQALQSRKQEVLSYIDGFYYGGLSEYKTSKLDALFSEKRTQLENAKTLEEVEKVYESIDSSYLEIINESEPVEEPIESSSCKCNNSSVVVMLQTMILIIASVIIVMRKKH